MSLPERFSSRSTPFDLDEIALSSSLVSLPAPGISRSIRYCGIAPPFRGGGVQKVGRWSDLSNTCLGASFSGRTALTNGGPMSVKHLHLVAIAAIAACAPSTSGTSNASGAPRSSNALTVEEITAFNTEGRTAFDVVSRLRPSWLRARGVQSIARASDSTEYALVIVD